MVTYECNYCEETTKKPLYDFCEIGWEAVSFNNNKAVCACSEHTKQLQEDIKNSIGKGYATNIALGIKKKELNDGYSAAMIHNIELANHNIKLSKELQEAQEKINQLVDNCNTLEVNKDAYKEELQDLHKREEHFIKEGLRLNQELQDKTKELEEYKAKVRK